MAASITLDRVTKLFPGGHAAVRDCSLTIEQGELLVLVGPSGSGKSTVLRLIAGLDDVTSGRVLIGDEDVTAVPPQMRDLAMVFQSYALYPHMTVRQNLAFGLRMRRTPADETAARVRETADMLGIASLLDRKPSQLSGGQRQRVALGRALARDARAYLLDEPLSNLDPLLRVGTRTELGLLHRRLAATMVYVTHDQEEAMTLGTRIATMRDGAIEQVGAPLDLYRRPASRFVAQFIGTPAMNVWTAAAAFEDGLCRIASPWLRADVAHESGRDRELPDVVDVGVRPHDIELCERSLCDGSGSVEVVEPLGPATVLHVRVTDSERSAAAVQELLRVVVPADVRVVAGDIVNYRVRRERLHLFDAASGRRLAVA